MYFTHATILSADLDVLMLPAMEGQLYCLETYDMNNKTHNHNFAGSNGMKTNKQASKRLCTRGVGTGVLHKIWKR